MSEKSPVILIGIGTCGCETARGVRRASGEELRILLADTDASSGTADDPFILLGGDRLSGHGSGGDMAQARLAAEDSLNFFNDHIEGVRLAVVATSLGGGTGSGATIAVCRHLRHLGIPTIVFATMPFPFEGDERQRHALGVTKSISEEANASIFLPLDRLVRGEDNMALALRRATDTMASGMALFWRLVAKPGYIKLDEEKIRQIVASAGLGRFAVATAQGPGRAREAAEALVKSPLLASSATPVRSIVCGILAGDDLRLSEIGEVADSLRAAFGERCAFNLGTVNDEATFSGRISVVAMLFEGEAGESASDPKTGSRKPSRRAQALNPLSISPQGRGRFNNVEPTVWRNEDLDIPTYLRRNIALEV